jgi:HPt (histidine-containing phosphotransfer) domain-containing protein
MSSRLDLSYLERLYKGDRTRMAQWVGIYLEEIPGHLQRLAACVQRDDREGLSAIVHDLRPQMHYLGAQRMLELLVRLSDAAKTTGAAACTPVLQELLIESDAVAAELRNVFP